MKKRYHNALAIQDGASNVSGITWSLLDAIKETREEGNDADLDVACRLIAHQLAFLFGVGDVDDNYDELIKECRDYAKTAP